jgi:hypothetical protein
LGIPDDRMKGQTMIDKPHSAGRLCALAQVQA